MHGGYSVTINNIFEIKIMLLRGAERIWQPSAARRSAAVPNGEGVASGSATTLLTIKTSILIGAPTLCQYYQTKKLLKDAKKRT